jgi:hypothetical protein
MEIKYGVEILVYAYDDNGEVELDSENPSYARAELTQTEADGIAKRLNDHLNEFTTASDEDEKAQPSNYSRVGRYLLDQEKELEIPYAIRNASAPKTPKKK